MARGDHLRASRPGYHHDGIDLGSGAVIHFSGGEGGTKASACIRIDSIAVFANGGTVSVRPYSGNRDPEQAVARALSRKGEGGYHLAFNNCEHFARWCVTGDHESEQVTTVASTGAAIGTTTLAAALGIDVVASAGLVSGVSGPGIMSGLATYGTLLGGGVIAGILLLSAAPGAASLAITRHALRDDDDLPDDERKARAIARAGSVAGAVAGAAGSIAAVSACGAVSGLSAAGISSGLAAIGGAFGGGMAAGTMAVIAAPAAAAALGGYLIYQLLCWLASPAAGPATSSAPRLSPG